MARVSTSYVPAIPLPTLSKEKAYVRMCLCARTRMNKCSYMYFDPAAPSFLSALQP